MMRYLSRGLFEHDIVLAGAFVDMYSKCAALRQVQSVTGKANKLWIISNRCNAKASFQMKSRSNLVRDWTH